MRLSDILAEKIERQPYRDYTGQELELTLIWSPTAREAKAAIDKALNKSLRVLVVDNKIVCWDAHYVEHRDVAKLLGHPELETGRSGKLFLLWDDERRVYRFGGGSWWGNMGGRRAGYVAVPDIDRLLKAGFEEPTRPPE